MRITANAKPWGPFLKLGAVYPREFRRQGQYGTAYRAKDKYDNQLYCIKRIPMSAKVSTQRTGCPCTVLPALSVLLLSGSLQDDHAGALREAQLLDSLDHPNIIR